MTATTSPLHIPDLAVLGATTVGYYLVKDLVKKPVLRRVVGAAVLATGVAAATELEQRSRADAAAAHTAQTASAEATARGGTGPTEVPATPGPARLLGTAALAVGAAAVGSWVTDRVDGAAAGLIARTGGKLPLVGGLVRRFPSTLWGLAQFGAVVGLDRATRPDASVSAVSQTVAKAESTKAGAQQ